MGREGTGGGRIMKRGILEEFAAVSGGEGWWQRVVKENYWIRESE